LSVVLIGGINGHGTQLCLKKLSNLEFRWMPGLKANEN
jgi:hypothetical protein